MTKTTIVDAIKSEIPNTLGVTNVTVPIKMDASALAKALQAAAATAEQGGPETVRVNPADLIKDASARMEELYTRFNALRQLGAELHGKTLSDQIPETIKIDDVSITFRAIKAGEASEPVVAHIKNVVCVGDIANLLSSELGGIILALEQEALAVKETATQAEETCTKARQQWEKNNPGRKIVMRGRDVEVGLGDVDGASGVGGVAVEVGVGDKNTAAIELSTVTLRSNNESSTV